MYVVDVAVSELWRQAIVLCPQVWASGQPGDHQQPWCLSLWSPAARYALKQNSVMITVFCFWHSLEHPSCCQIMFCIALKLALSSWFLDTKSDVHCIESKLQSRRWACECICGMREEEILKFCAGQVRNGRCYVEVCSYQLQFGNNKNEKNNVLCCLAISNLSLMILNFKYH